MTEKGLKSGREFSFSNEEEVLQADVMYEKSRSGHMMYKVWFNGTIVKMAKTYKPIQTKVNDLVVKFELSPVTEN